MPKCTIAQIQTEIAQLEGKGFHCAIEYLKAELDRRKGSATNQGRPATNDSPKHKKWREASKRYREKQEKPEVEQTIVPIDDI